MLLFGSTQGARPCSLLPAGSDHSCNGEALTPPSQQQRVGCDGAGGRQEVTPALCMVFLPCAGHASVLHCETPHGDCHHHPAGVREVPRRGLQVRMLGGAGRRASPGGRGQDGPCSIGGDGGTCWPSPGSEITRSPKNPRTAPLSPGKIWTKRSRAKIQK